MALAAIVAAACGGGKQTAKAPGGPALVVQPLGSAAARGARERDASVARSHAIASIARAAIGPFVARAGGAALAAWIVAPDRGAGQTLAVVPLATNGAPLGYPRVVAAVPQEATSLVVRPAGARSGGWIAVWSALMDRGESLTALGIAPDGAARGAPADVQRTSDHVAWSDVIPTARGALCVWAEETTAGQANVLAAPLDADGRPRAAAVRVARDVAGWAAAAAADGAGLALVSRPKDAKAGTLSWVRIDADAHVASAPIAIANEPSVSSEVEVASTGEGAWALAWTDRGGEDPQVMIATVDAAGHVRGPRRALDAAGGSSLVAIASGAAGAAMAWEEPHAAARARATRTLHLASVSTGGEPAAQSVTSIDTAAGAPAPELVATDHGFALLATAHACSADRPCVLAPTFVRFDARFAPAQTEPLFAGAASPAALGWALRCEGDGCFALAASSETPTSVFAVDLAPRSSPFVAPIVAAPPADAPRVTGVTTIASGQPFEDIAVARVGESTIAAAMTGSNVIARVLDSSGRPAGEATRVTARALAVGGVAMAAGGRAEDGAAVAWVARDDGDPQVHVARIDRHGKRVSEVQLTTSKGDASDVAIAWTGDGWIVAWVDGRDGNGEVYATKVDRDLNRVAREERITNAPGDAGDVAVVVRGDTAWLAWSDPRESPREGIADVFTTTVRTRDARRSGDETRVLATAAHSRSSRLAAAGDGAVVAWIEASPAGLDAPGAAMAARLDGAGRVVGAPWRIALAPDATPASIELASAGDVVRAVVARSAHGSVTLDAVALSADAPSAKAWTLLDLDAPASFDVTLALSDDAVFFVDSGSTAAARRVRRAAVAWRR